MILRSARFLIILALLLAACAAPSPARPPAASLKAPPATLAPTHTPALKSTPIDIPTLIPTATTAPSNRVHFDVPVPRPLSGQAPWLAYPCAEPGAYAVPTIANADGSGCVPFTLPSLPADRAWISLLPAHGSYAAFRVRIQPKMGADGVTPDPLNAAYLLQPNGLDDQIWIVKLPENRIVRTITQMDPSGWERIQKLWANPTHESSAGSGVVPLPLGIILAQDSYRWSADGRYLAYTGVNAEGADLYVYDTLTGTIRRMTHGRQGAYIWSWSPNNKWIVYHELTGCRLAKDCQFDPGPNYYAVTFPALEFQFANRYPSASIDWIGKDRYILQDLPQPGQLSSHLEQVDLNFGTVTTLYNQPFYAYTFLPSTYITKKELYFLNLPAAPASDRVTGLYSLFPFAKKDQLKPYETKNFGDYKFQWDRTLERFILAKPLTGAAPSQDIRMISLDLQEKLPLPSLGSPVIDVSPDGRWFAGQLSSGSWALFNAQGQQIQELGPGLSIPKRPVTWVQDSNSFYFSMAGQSCKTQNGCIYQYLKGQNWKPVLVGEIKDRTDLIQVIDSAGS